MRDFWIEGCTADIQKNRLCMEAAEEKMSKKRLIRAAKGMASIAKKNGMVGFNDILWLCIGEIDVDRQVIEILDEDSDFLSRLKLSLQYVVDCAETLDELRDAVYTAIEENGGFEDDGE